MNRYAAPTHESPLAFIAFVVFLCFAYSFAIGAIAMLIDASDSIAEPTMMWMPPDGECTGRETSGPCAD